MSVNVFAIRAGGSGCETVRGVCCLMGCRHVGCFFPEQLARVAIKTKDLECQPGQLPATFTPTRATSTLKSAFVITFSDITGRIARDGQPALHTSFEQLRQSLANLRK